MQILYPRSWHDLSISRCYSPSILSTLCSHDKDMFETNDWIITKCLKPIIGSSPKLVRSTNKFLVFADLDIYFLYDWQAWPIWRISWHPQGLLWSGWSEIKSRRPRSLYRTTVSRREVPRPTNLRDCTMIQSRSISKASYKFWILYSVNWIKK